MSCPNQATSITIPFPTGAATVVPLDGNTCNAIDATMVKVQFAADGSVVNGTTKPAVSSDGSGLHFSANGLSFGSKATLLFTYVPNGLTWQMTYTVGGAVSPVGSTTTP